MNKLQTFVKRKNTNIFKISSMNYLYWTTFSAYYPFVTVYLASKGFDNTKIGMILAANSFIAVFAQPFWGFMSDWVRSVRKVFLICLVCASALWLSLSFIDSIIIIPFIFIILTFFESPLPPLTDNWIVQGIRNETVNFGNIRFLGSIGFGIMVYINGLIVEKRGIQAIFYCYAILATITFIVCYKNHVGGNAPVTHVKKLKVSELFKNYYYVTFLIFASILFIPHRSSYTYLPKLIEAVGGTKENYGMAVSLIAFSEIPLFLFSGYLLRKFKPIYLIIASTFFFIARQALFMVSTTPVHVILASSLQGPSYALFLAGTMYYIDAQTPYELKFTAQLLGSAIFSGISGIIGNFSAGMIIDSFGLPFFYKTGTSISISITILFLLSLFLGKKITGKSAFDIE